jgi:hypothetical protein
MHWSQSPCRGLQDDVDNLIIRGLHELNLDVSTEDFSALKGRLHTTCTPLGNRETVVCLTPHAAVTGDGDRDFLGMQLDETSCRLAFIADGKGIVALLAP